LGSAPPTLVAGIGGNWGKVSRTTEDPATAPNATHSTGEAVAPIGGHGRLDHFQRLEKGVSELFWIGDIRCRKGETRTCPNEVTSNKFKPAPSSRLLNLTGFFSSLGATAFSVAVDILCVGDALKGALTKGCWGLRRLLRDQGRRVERKRGRGRALVEVAKGLDERKKEGRKSSIVF